ncbi:MAG: carboxypeptidase M32 [Rhodospirillales bacterium]|nr:MAG: carboxypeptidase M32 [Rhodospirillales bacterium]
MTGVRPAAGAVPGPAYRTLERRFRRLLALRDAEAMLHWDLATMMPRGGSESRSEQLAALKTVRHGMLTAPDMADLLAAAEAEREAESSLDDWQTANLREMRRTWTHATALSESQVEALSRAVSACEAAWRSARADSDFAAVRPKLAAVLGLVRECAEAKGERLGLAPYDALLDEYEPDVRAAEIDRLFEPLAAFLKGFLPRVLDRQAAEPPVLPIEGPFPVETQQALALRLMRMLGFDFDHGRLDVSLHPFCGGTPDDVRITTRYDENDFASALMGVLHETGHALYERGLPRDWRGQPVGEPRGIALHESQSLLIEMQVCRSRPFLALITPMLREAFGGDGPAWEPENVRRLYTRVAPGFIRVDADEVTYPAHVILRYRLETAMIAGELDVSHLPDAWTAGMEELLGLTPPDDRRGCLQDIHWYDGAWAYFPTYTLGAMIAAQLFQSATAASPDIPAGIARGDFVPLLAWLRAHVHEKGSRLSPRELLVAATGSPLDPRYFERHLERRYLGVAAS